MCQKVRKFYRCAHNLETTTLCAKVPKSGIIVLCENYESFPRIITEKCPQCLAIDEAEKRQADKELEKVERERDARAKGRPEIGCLGAWLWW
jgi:hypothetical protein